MELANWINVIFTVLTWGAIFLLIKPNRIRDLLPAGILAGILLFIGEQVFIHLGLIRFHAALIPLAGVPLFNILWGVGGGILVMAYMKREFSQKFIMILLFTAVNEVLTYIAIQVGNLSFLGKYNTMYDTFMNLVFLLLFVQIAEGLFGKRIYH